MNKVILCGRLGRDPETRYNGDKAVSKFNLAVDRRFSKEKETDWINCVCFGKVAEFSEKYLAKGIKVMVVGRIQTGSYVNRDNTRVYTTDVICDEIEFAESKAANESNRNRNDGPSPAPESNSESLPGDFTPTESDFFNPSEEDDLPFL